MLNHLCLAIIVFQTILIIMLAKKVGKLNIIILSTVKVLQYSNIEYLTLKYSNFTS